MSFSETLHDDRPWVRKNWSTFGITVTVLKSSQLER